MARTIAQLGKRQNSIAQKLDEKQKVGLEQVEDTPKGMNDKGVRFESVQRLIAPIVEKVFLFLLMTYRDL